MYVIVFFIVNIYLSHYFRLCFIGTKKHIFYLFQLNCFIVGGRVQLLSLYVLNVLPSIAVNEFVRVYMAKHYRWRSYVCKIKAFCPKEELCLCRFSIILYLINQAEGSLKIQINILYLLYYFYWQPNFTEVSRKQRNGLSKSAVSKMWTK